MKTVAVVPARAGSSIRDKNLLIVNGVSLLERAVRCALEVPGIERVIVSSDSHAYLERASSWGAELHLRPEAAASSTATAQDAVDSLPKMEGYSHMVYLQPTSPLRTNQHIEEALTLAEMNPLHSVISVTEVTQHPEKMLQIGESGLLNEVFANEGSSNLNRQSLASYLYPNGAIYVLPRHQDGGFSFTSSPRIGYRMSVADSIDIDSMFDLLVAEAVLNERDSASRR